MAEIINSLEKTLCLWEDLCFLFNCLAKFHLAKGDEPRYTLKGPFINYPHLRSYLQQLRPLQPIGDALMDERFVEPYWPDKPPALGDLAQLPLELALWLSASKRLYQLDDSMQLLLNATSVKNISWERVKLPFDAFAIKLAKPIIGSTEKETYDFVLVSSYTSIIDVDVLQLRLLPMGIKAYQPISAEEKAVMLNFVAKGRWRRLKERIDQYYFATPRPLLSPIFTLHLTPQALKAKVTTSIIELEKIFISQIRAQGLPIAISDFVQEMPLEGATTARLIVCLSLFLTTRQGQQVKHYIHREPKTTRVQSCKAPPIGDKTEIFQLTNSRSLSAQEQEQCSNGLSSSGITVCPHFREGCWRFPPNKADDPTAEKTVWVRPSFIHADQLPEGEQPNGSEVRIKTPQS